MPDVFKGLGKDMAWRFKEEILRENVTISNIRNLISEKPMKRETKNVIPVEEKSTLPEIVQKGSCVLTASRLAISLGISRK